MHTRVWTRQHPAIEIDGDKDIIEDGDSVYTFLKKKGIRYVALMGVHANICIVSESAASIQQMLEQKMGIVLVRDLTDAMYNPADPPFVSHDEGTQLVVGYIEKFWCPTITSADLTYPSHHQ
jgi:hypothetical protein